MKIKALNFAALAAVLLISCTSLSVRPAATAPAVTAAVSSAVDESAVLSARFLNMLNHGTAYDSALDSVAELVLCAQAALLQNGGNYESFIPESELNAYLFSMYGVEGVDYGAVTSGFPQREGFVYIVPRGFSVYRHSSPTIAVNEDGSYTVTTEVEITTHDNGTEYATAKTLFVKNSASAFGFNIISSELAPTAPNTDFAML